MHGEKMKFSNGQGSQITPEHKTIVSESWILSHTVPGRRAANAVDIWRFCTVDQSLKLLNTINTYSVAVRAAKHLHISVNS
jgi:hypothetical protein